MFSEDQIRTVLAKLCPQTNKFQLERFVSPIITECQEFDITSVKRLSAFLATICYESDKLRKVREGLAKKGTKVRAMQDKYWATGFYGRGPIQISLKRNYTALTAYAQKEWRDKEYSIPAPDFVKNPDLLLDPGWGIYAACWFWTVNKLNAYADLHDFDATQGIVNKGDPEKLALGIEFRRKLYKTAYDYLDSLAPANSPNPKTSADEPAVTSSVSADPPVQTPPNSFNNDVDATTPSKSILGKLSDFVAWLQGLADRSANVEASVSRSSWATYTFKQILALAMLFLAWLYSNPEYLLGAIALIALATWYLTRSKERANAQKLALIDAETWRTQRNAQSD